VLDFEQVERLIDEADERCLPVVAALVEMYGEGLKRVVGSLPADQLVKLTEDPLVGHLLVLHDLHPVSVENRVREAVAATGAYAVVVAVEDAVVRLRAADDGRRQVIQDAVTAAAPDIDRVEFVDQLEPVVVLPQVSA
jgi:hypothetical protein